MRRLLPLIFAAALPGLAFAQSQPYQPGAAPLSPQGAPGQPALELKSTHGAWQVRCFQATCIMTQFHARTDSTSDAVVTLSKPNDPSGALTTLAEIVVPLGVYLPTGIGLQVDNGEVRAAPFERCLPLGCVVRAPVSPQMLDQLKRGGTAYLVMATSPVENVRVPISLQGFTAAFNSF